MSVCVSWKTDVVREHIRTTKSVLICEEVLLGPALSHNAVVPGHLQNEPVRVDLLQRPQQIADFPRMLDARTLYRDIMCKDS
jgi:hypothetical protein